MTKSTEIKSLLDRLSILPLKREPNKELSYLTKKIKRVKVTPIYVDFNQDSADENKK